MRVGYRLAWCIRLGRRLVGPLCVSSGGPGFLNVEDAIALAKEENQRIRCLAFAVVFDETLEQVYSADPRIPVNMKGQWLESAPVRSSAA